MESNPFTQSSVACQTFGGETVLVVEDDPSVGELIAEMLRLRGYTVLHAADGEEALRLVESRLGEPIHLLLTDMAMPHMGGNMLARRLRAIHPSLKVLFVSGDSEDVIIEAGMPFLPKPFSVSDLVRKVREVLDGQSETDAKAHVSPNLSAESFLEATASVAACSAQGIGFRAPIRSKPRAPARL